ncbi:major capsid protein [Klebsiella phage vB_Kpn_3]|nr:major capsid protein [Klebsiella phage vB_Kpn_3]
MGCDTEVDTDLETLEEWEELDIAEQNAIIRQSFWEAVDCHVAFCKDDDEANTCTNYGYEHDDVECE